MNTKPDSIEHIKSEIKAYKRKFFINQLIKGSILFVGLSLLFWLSVSVFEYVGKLPGEVRALFFFGGIILIVGLFIYRVGLPLLHILRLDHELSDEEASKKIGEHFPDVKDRLLNTLQLFKEYDQGQGRSLVLASIHQRSSNLGKIRFREAINLKVNTKYAYRYLIIPIVILILLLIMSPSMLYEGTDRIMNYNKNYVPQSPFQFETQYAEYQIFKNESLVVETTISGDKIPDQCYVHVNGRNLKMEKGNDQTFSYQFQQLSQDETFYFTASGFDSREMRIIVVNRPELETFNAKLIFPKYLNRKAENLTNISSLVVPEGTHVYWQLSAQHADQLSVLFQPKDTVLKKNAQESFAFDRVLLQNTQYELGLINAYDTSHYQYEADVIKDAYPKISVEEKADTSSYQYLLVGGMVSDDYGLRALSLHYKISGSGSSKQKWNKKSIKLHNNQPSQAFYTELVLSDLDIKSGDQLEYYLQVWDNDGVNGSKSTKSAIYQVKVPTEKEIDASISKQSSQTQKKLNESKKNSQSLSQELKKISDELKTKKNLEWEDKKDIEKLLERHDALKKDVDKLKKQMKEQKRQLEEFKNLDKELAEKYEKVQELMDKALDDETKKLMEELQKLMDQQQTNPEETIEKLEDLAFKDEQLEKELDRAIEMFKQLQFEQKLKENIDKLSELKEKQKQLAEENEEGEKSTEDLAEEQKELNKEFEEFQEDMKEMEEMNESLEKKHELEDFEPQEQDIEQQQKESSEKLESGEKQKAGESQQKAGEKMEQMQQQMQQMQQQMQANETQENLDDLRALLENLIALSQEQEELMVGLKNVKPSDPRYVQLSQRQLQLNDNAKVIEDSLYALAKRVIQIESIITKEAGNMRKSMEESAESLKTKRPSRAAGDQQYAMTAANNLAVMLNDVLDQMQQQMSSQMPGSQTCNKPGKSKGSKPKPNLGKMQQQLNGMIQELKNGQRQGRSLSQQLAKSAEQQERIRRALKEMGKEAGNDQKLGNKLRELEQLMKETEKDIVNNNVTDRTIERQKDIQTRLLEAEKASRERDQDNKRESKTAQQYKHIANSDFEEYIRKKQQQLELLKTIPPGFSNFYKKEVNEYFKRIEN